MNFFVSSLNACKLSNDLFKLRFLFKMTDKSDKTLKNTVIVLQNITLKKNPVSCISNENDSNINNITKRRYTSSSYIFDEEPLFSDSEEETEYFNNILAVQNLTCIDEMPKRLDVEVQCDITSDNLKIVDVIEKCASFDVGKLT